MMIDFVSNLRFFRHSARRANDAERRPPSVEPRAARDLVITALIYATCWPSEMQLSLGTFKFVCCRLPGRGLEPEEFLQ